MAEVRQADVEAVVSPSGDVVISSEDVQRLALAPGQHVRVTVTARPRRQNMYGILAGRLSEVDPEAIKRVRREVWGELAAER